ncbi:hypothetical protein ONZ45_g4166 [Pleurotus djamor]|nr:hypothetical protein ONZ45_g4166 [Pleurotus djamor]
MSDASNPGVLYFDLDIKSYDLEPDASILFRNEEEYPPITFMNAWVDYTCSDLQFNLATTYAPYDEDWESTDPYAPQPHTTIWRVIESEDSKLTATQIATFAIDPPFHENTCLLGSMFAYWMGPNLLEVINFEVPNNEDDGFPMTSLVAMSPRSTWALMQLLPDRKVVVLRPDTLSIYHIPRPTPRSTVATVISPDEETPFFNFKLPRKEGRFIQSLSRLQVSYTGVVQLTIATTQAFFSLSKNSSDEVEFNDLMIFFSRGEEMQSNCKDLYIIGPHGSLYRGPAPIHYHSRSPYMFLLTFRRSFAVGKPLDPDDLPAMEVIPPQWDEWSGRTVYVYETGELVVTDM